jgi:hypothetical protein
MIYLYTVRTEEEAEKLRMSCLEVGVPVVVTRPVRAIDPETFGQTKPEGVVIEVLQDTRQV